MHRTQVQISDELYERTLELLEHKEWTMSEAVRRGLELLLSQNLHEQAQRMQLRAASNRQRYPFDDREAR